MYQWEGLVIYEPQPGVAAKTGVRYVGRNTGTGRLKGSDVRTFNTWVI